jgi:hypothetical protein
MVVGERQPAIMAVVVHGRRNMRGANGENGSLHGLQQVGGGGTTNTREALLSATMQVARNGVRTVAPITAAAAAAEVAVTTGAATTSMADSLLSMITEAAAHNARAVTAAVAEVVSPVVVGHQV